MLAIPYNYKKQLDFLFISSPTNARNPHPPYYFMYLAAYLRNNGLRVKIIDVKGGDRPSDIENHYQTIRNELSKNPSFFVGLAAFHSDYPTVMRLGKIVKEIQPWTTLVIGNAHATINPEDFIFVIVHLILLFLGKVKSLHWNSLKEVNMRKQMRNWQEVFSCIYIK